MSPECVHAVQYMQISANDDRTRRALAPYKLLVLSVTRLVERKDLRMSRPKPCSIDTIPHAWFYRWIIMFEQFNIYKCVYEYVPV